MNPLPYLEELLSLNNRNVRIEKAKELCSKYVKYIKIGYFDSLPHYEKRGHCSGADYVSCVFGGFSNTWYNYFATKYWSNREPKNGIEILGAEPNATGTTYSKKCRITVKELKEACKMNGIKIKGDKKAMLSALMKI